MFSIITFPASTSNRIATIENAHVRNYPIKIPGYVYPSGTLNILRPAVDGYRLDVTVEKFFFYDYLRIPCISRVGSWYVESKYGILACADSKGPDNPGIFTTLIRAFAGPQNNDLDILVRHRRI